MNDLEQRLRAAFTASEDLAPDPSAVLAGVDAAVARHRRRRRAVRAAGGTALAAGVGAAFLLSTAGVPWTGRSDAVNPAASSPAPSSSPVPTYEGRFLEAFDRAGYTYADAVALADLWDLPDAGAGKATGGEKLLDGIGLPVEPGSTPLDYDASDDHARWVFFNADYTYADAVALGEVWGVDDALAVKARAGRELIAGATLPVEPGSTPVPDGDDGGGAGDGAYSDPASVAAWTAFADAGYDYVDAQHLAALWVGDVPHRTGDLLSDVKARAGQELLDGAALPVPAGQPWAADGEPVAAGALERFAEAGYTYDDAVALTGIWGAGDETVTKAVAGLKLAAGAELPVRPGEAPPAVQVPGPGAEEQRAVEAFFAAGYDYDDALALGALWTSADAYDAKVTAGRKLLAGEVLPLRPGQG